MKFNLKKIIYFSILSRFFSASQIIPKLCIDCKFYKNNFFTISKFGKCSLFPIEKYDDYFWVNGKNYNNTEYHFCSTSRKFDDMCGKEGKHFEQK